MRFDFDSNRTFGIELEVGHAKSLDYITRILRKNTRKYVLSEDHWTPTSNNDYWHVKADNTCGWEIASFKARGKENLDEIAYIAEALQREGVRVTDKCGFHIHADISDFSLEQAAIIMARWVKIEPYFFGLVPFERQINEYCKPIRETKMFNQHVTYAPLDFWELTKPRNLAVIRNLEKRVALSFINFLRADESFGDPTKKTVELRLPEGTLSPGQIVSWVRTFLWFVDSCKNKSMPTDLKPVTSVKKFLYYLGRRNIDITDCTIRWILASLSIFGKKSMAEDAFELLKERAIVTK